MPPRRDDERTRTIAHEAARLLAEGHYQDIHGACRKAAERLGVSNPRHWPDATAIETALREYQALFQSHSQPVALNRLRRLALAAMQDLAEFKPLLVGPVATGLADQYSAVRLLLHADTPEHVAMALENRRIPWRSAEVTLLFSRNRRLARPAFRFQAGDTLLELVILAATDRQDPPRDAGGTGPLPSVSTKQLQKLLAAEDVC